MSARSPASRPPSRNPVAVLLRGYAPPHGRAWWRLRVLRMMRLLGVSGEVSLLFTDDPGIRRLNRDYRGADRATDVLAFPGGAAAAPGAPRVLGDVVISGPTAGRNARRFHQSLEAELLRLAAHGLLHLLGFDHEKDAGEMNAEQERLLREAAGPPAPPRRKAKEGRRGE